MYRKSIISLDKVGVGGYTSINCLELLLNFSKLYVCS